MFLSSCYCCAFMADEVQSCLHAERNVSCIRLEVFDAGRGQCSTSGVAGMLVLLPPAFLTQPLVLLCGRSQVGLCSSRTAPKRVPFLMGIQLYSHVVQPGSCSRAVPVCFSFVCLAKLCFLPLLQEFSLGPTSLYVKNPKSHSAQHSSDLCLDDRGLRNHTINVSAL